MIFKVRTIHFHGLKKGFSLKFPEIYQLQETPEEGWRVQHLKCCGDNNNHDKDTNMKVG